MISRPSAFERAVAIFLARSMLGFVFLFAGVHKLTGVGAVEFGRGWAQIEDVGFLPASLVTAIGVATPFVELTLGVLLLAGLWTRQVLRAAAALVIAIAVAYGVHGLRHPVGATAMNISIVNFYILPRAVLVMFVLFLARDDDRLSVGWLLDGRRRSTRTGDGLR